VSPHVALRDDPPVCLGFAGQLISFERANKSIPRELVGIERRRETILQRGDLSLERRDVAGKTGEAKTAAIADEKLSSTQGSSSYM
jgi:hypothetical protein